MRSLRVRGDTLTSTFLYGRISDRKTTLCLEGRYLGLRKPVTMFLFTAIACNWLKWHHMVHMFTNMSTCLMYPGLLPIRVMELPQVVNISVMSSEMGCVVTSDTIERKELFSHRGWRSILLVIAKQFCKKSWLFIVVLLFEFSRNAQIGNVVIFCITS